MGKNIKLYHHCAALSVKKKINVINGGFPILNCTNNAKDKIFTKLITMLEFTYL